MKKLMFAFLVVFFLVGCGTSNEEVNVNQEQDVTEQGLAQEIAEEKEEQESLQDKRTNAQKLRDYIVSASKETHFDRRRNFVDLMWEVQEQYQDDIINPYTGATSLGYSNTSITYMKTEQWTIAGQRSAFVYMITSARTTMRRRPPEDISISAFSGNKGVVVGVLFGDGIYIYEVGEDGSKENELVHLFEWEWDEEYDEYWFELEKNSL